MKTLIFITALLAAVTSSAQVPRYFNNKTGTAFNGNYAYPSGHFVLLDASNPPTGTVIHKVTLKRNLPLLPKAVDLTFEVYNILYDDKSLVVFSVMPSLYSKDPKWKKVDIDTLKGIIITLTQLKDTIAHKLKSYPQRRKGRIDQLKYQNYTLLVKKPDGYYRNDTDCLTEFFTITSNNDYAKTSAIQINLSAKMFSAAEYESAYRRKYGDYSANYKGSNAGSYNPELEDGANLYLSYINQYQGKKQYHFWLLDTWVSDSFNSQRGMDRFVFEPGIGIISASYDFYIYDLSSYWTNVAENSRPDAVVQKQEWLKSPAMTPFSKRIEGALYDYLIESTIKTEKIEKL